MKSNKLIDRRYFINEDINVKILAENILNYVPILQE